MVIARPADAQASYHALKDEWLRLAERASILRPDALLCVFDRVINCSFRLSYRVSGWTGFRIVVSSRPFRSICSKRSKGNSFCAGRGACAVLGLSPLGGQGHDPVPRPVGGPWARLRPASFELPTS